MFYGRKLLIATKHEKEKVIAPILEKELGVHCFLLPHFDSDELGTFTGEIERKDDPITTARNKCLMAMQLTDCDLAVASEGSFGPHPFIFFVPADDEFLILIDKKNKLEIVVRELSAATNFYGSDISSEKELNAFAEKACFPSHAIIAKNTKEHFSAIEKGITSWKKLLEVYTQFIKEKGSVYMETDMRAMYNPSRMQVIEKATIKLVDKINSRCPACHAPGFGITEARPGLPCELCNAPTRSVLSYLYACATCGHSEEKRYPKNKFKEDPGYCDNCNP